jgi:heme/copper-type cytochrome/quinol oxidase subunit 1
MYIIFASVAAVLGSVLSLMIRLELAFPGNQIFAGDYQHYNVVITSHALVMIFFCGNASFNWWVW